MSSRVAPAPGSHVPVLIVGAGPVGLALAALLNRHGVRTRVIERNGGPTEFSKAIGIHARTLETMHALGISDDLIDQGNPMSGFQLHDKGGAFMRAGFSGIDSAYQFVLGLPQSRTERTLLAALQGGGGDVDWNTELVELLATGCTGSDAAADVARVRISGPRGEEEVTCRWLIGADGSRSTVRELAGIEFPGGDYGRAFVLGDVEVDWDGPLSELQFFLSEHGYLLLVPMPDGMHRIIAQTDKRYEDFQGVERTPPTLRELQDVVDRNGPAGMRVHSPTWLTEAPFYHRLATTPQRGRVLLTGDAFHLFSPLGAQGLNTGLQDAVNLAWKLSYVEHGWAASTLVRTYAAEREPIAEAVGQVTGRTTAFITARKPAARTLRRHASRLLNDTARVQDRLPTMLAGLAQRYTDSALIGESEDGLPPVGSRFPHAWVAHDQGYLPIAARTHGQHFTVLITQRRVDAGEATELEEAARACRVEFPYVRVLLACRELEHDSSRPQSSVDVEIVHDRLGSVFAAVGNDPATFLIRPDGVTALSVRGRRLDAVTEYLTGHGFVADRHDSPSRPPSSGAGASDPVSEHRRLQKQV